MVTPELWLLSRAAAITLIVVGIEFRAPIWKRMRSWRERRTPKKSQLPPHVKRALEQTYGGRR